MRREKELSSHVLSSLRTLFSFLPTLLDVIVSRQQGPLSLGNWPSRIESVTRDVGH